MKFLMMHQKNSIEEKIYELQQKKAKLIDNMLSTDATFINKLSKDAKKEYIKVFIDTCKWLDEHFKGNNPPITIKYKVENVTEFTKKVIDCIKEIPYGKTITYKEKHYEIKTFSHRNSRIFHDTCTCRLFGR